MSGRARHCACSYPAARPVAQRPAASPVYETFAEYQSDSAILAATTTFAAVATFAGRPDSIEVFLIGGPVDVRLRNRGEPAGEAVTLPSGGTFNFRVGAEIVEARDPAGAGAQRVTSIGRYRSSRTGLREEPSNLP